MGVEKPAKAKEGKVAGAIADGLIKPWWEVVKVPRWLRAVGVRKGWIEFRQRYDPGPVMARLTPEGMAIRDRTLAERAELADKERKR